MAYLWAPSSKKPSHYVIQPREQMIMDASPWTGTKEVMFRWHQWHAILTWNHLTNTEYWRLFGQFSSSVGGSVLFRVPVFSYRDKRGTKTGSVTLSGSHAAGVTSLTITGGSGTLTIGDWVEIERSSGNPCAYMIVSPETANVIGIHPPLRKTASGGTVVQHFSSGTISDTMELVENPSFASAMPSKVPGLFQPFTLEFVSALRTNL